MKNLFITLITFLSFHCLSAQIDGITNTGDEVLLYDNGTWTYKNVKEKENEKIKIPTNKTVFKKDKKSTFLIKSNKIEVGVWINPKEWTFTKNEIDEDAEFTFQKKGDDIYAMIITEKIEIPLENLKEIAIDNAKSILSNFKVQNEEYRTLNGNKIFTMQMIGETQGIKFAYFGYYFSNENGTTQFLAYTSEKMLKSNESIIENFLNGFVTLK